MSSKAFAPSSTSTSSPPRRPISTIPGPFRREDHRDSLENHSPDYMENDPLLENLKTLNEETKSDDDEEPTTSGPLKVLPTLTPTYRSLRKTVESGRFMFIWFLNNKIPALYVGGEARLPIELLRHLMETEKKHEEIAEMLDKVLRSKNIHTRMATARQINMFNEKSEKCKSLNLASITLVNRSDIERIMGEMRIESRPTQCETNEPWNDNDRIPIVHTNFLDYCDEWLESEDLSEDEEEMGTHGFWYKNRANQRSIVCKQCRFKFTPADFILHHHFPVKNVGIVHVGINSAKWAHYIKIHRDHRTEENLAAWEEYAHQRTRGISKRAYDDAAPQSSLFENHEMRDIEMREEEEEDREEVKKTKQVELYDYDPDIDGPNPKKLHIADFMGPSGSKGFKVKPRNELEANILNALNRLDKVALEHLFLKSPLEFNVYMRDQEFGRKIQKLHEKWAEWYKKPDALMKVSSHFNPKTGEFENMHYYAKASKAVKMEVQELQAKFAKIDRSGDFFEILKAEQALYRSASDEATCILANIPYQPPPPPPAIEKLPQLPIVAPLLKPMGINPVNLLMVAQQLMASGKAPQLAQIVQGLPPQLPLISPALPLPLLPMPIKPVPLKNIATPPILPIGLSHLPIAQQVEIMKYQLAMMANSTSKPQMPLILPKMTNLEQLVAQLKAPPVQN